MSIIGLHEFLAALKKTAEQADVAASRAVTVTAALAESEAKKAFQGSHAKGEAHVGGDAPNVVTGTARRSITTDPVTRYGISDFGTRVAPHVAYGRRLELGYPGGGSGRGRGRTRPHPYFIPAATKASSEFREIAAEQWRKFLLG